MSRTSPASQRAPARVALLGALVCVLALCFAPAAMASEAEYDPPDAGNPVRIAAYVLHPVGVVYDYLILRPAWWVGSYEPFRTMFGRGD